MSRAPHFTQLTFRPPKEMILLKRNQRVFISLLLSHQQKKIRFRFRFPIWSGIFCDKYSKKSSYYSGKQRRFSICFVGGKKDRRKTVMGSEQNDSISFRPAEPKLCVNGCGFFGMAANMNLCSKCYRDLRVKEERTASAKAAVEKSLNPNLEAQRKQGDVATVGAESVVGSSSVGSSSTSGGDGAVAPREPRRPIPTKCFNCSKKVGLTGFKCKCGSMFCGVHRYPEKHDCRFDFKEAGRDAIAKANPVVKADKVDKI